MSQSHPLLALGLLALPLDVTATEELNLPLETAGPNGMGLGELTRLREVVPVAQPSSATTQPHILGLALASPNIHPIYDLLELMKDWTCGNDSHRLSMAGATAEYLRGVMMVYERPEASNQTNDSWQ
ncbi:hypothetical protein NN561_000139 [Cricetulus griseus]